MKEAPTNTDNLSEKKHDINNKTPNEKYVLGKFKYKHR